MRGGHRQLTSYLSTMLPTSQISTYSNLAVTGYPELMPDVML